MVAATSADLYTPFPSNLVIEDGVQSSEEGSNSDIHSPVFEVPYPPDGMCIFYSSPSDDSRYYCYSTLLYYQPKQKVRYHLGHLSPPDASTSFVPAPFGNARYSQHDLSIQVPDPHLLGNLQSPGSTTVQHLLPHTHSHHPHPSHSHAHSHVDYGRLQHPVQLDIGMEPPPLIQPPAALSPSDEYSFNLPSSRIPEQQLRASYDPPPPTSRGSIAMPPAASMSEQKQPSSRASPAAKGNSPGGSSSQSQAGPSRPPRREASTVVIACRQWYVLYDIKVPMNFTP